MSKLYGKYRGEVIDPKDPKKRGRVLIKVPSLGDVELGWAECCLPPQFFTIPQRGNFVWIEFEEGDMQKPIWVGIMPTDSYYKKLLEGQASYDTTSFIVKPVGNLELDAGKGINAKSKEDLKLTSLKALNVTGATLVNSKGWSIDKID